MMRKFKTICNASFGRFALREQPAKYNAITFCHGDIQMYNILYGKKEDGGITDDLVAMIDFQIVLYGGLISELFYKLFLR
jgi:Ser/Thr protein kinase RdoA (MazF antagonist)